uniref:Site-specific DNA-methyltransferase (adenine-specific) n=1 Tax=Heterorhabditis bacteriophora TaxID=37862 RepID=A0A1I7XL02_HETBA
MQNFLAGQRFQDVVEVRKWIDDFIASKPTSFFHEGNRKLPERWQKVIESEGKYFDDSIVDNYAELEVLKEEDSENS